MNGLFYKCSSLIILPDISKWNTTNVTDLSDIFAECSSLSKLPDISKWNTTNVTNLSENEFFDGCLSLLVIPHL